MSTTSPTPVAAVLDVEMLPVEVREAVDGYTARLAECIKNCAGLLRQDPEEFLWNARRAAEAICLLLLTVRDRKIADNPWDEGGHGRRGGHPSLDGIVTDLASTGTIDREIRIALDTLRSNTNPGVHLSGPVKPEYIHLTTTVRASLPVLVGWLYADSPASPFLKLCPPLREDLERLRKDLEGEPPLDHQVRDLRNQLQVMKEQLADAVNQYRAARSNQESLERELDQVRQSLRQPPAGSTLPRRPLLVLGVVPALLGGVLGLGAGALLAGSMDTRGEPIPEQAVAMELPPAEAVPATGASEAEAAAPPTPAPVVPPCPAGMVRVEGSVLQIAQPQGGRTDWPPPVPMAIAPIEVPAFCIDLAPVGSTAEGLQVVAAPCEGNARDRGPDGPAACVTREEAETHCAARGARLPGVAEWEAFERTPAWAEAKRGIPREWVGDRFPPAVFNRRGRSASEEGMFRDRRIEPLAEPAVHWSWSRQDPGKRWVNLGFRCAMSLPAPAGPGEG